MQTNSARQNEAATPALEAKTRPPLSGKISFIIGISCALVLGVGLFVWTVVISRSRQLSPLEQTLFQLFLVALSGLFTWVVAKRSERENVLASQKALARSAVRRINSIAASANRLASNIDRCRSEIASTPVWSNIDPVRQNLLLEMFDGLGRQVAENKDNIAASSQDWRDILPEEFEKQAEAEREILKAREVALEEKRKVILDLQNQIERGNVQTDEQITQLRNLMGEQIANLEKQLLLKIDQIRSQGSGSLFTRDFAFLTQPFIYDQGREIVGPTNIIIGRTAEPGTENAAPQPKAAEPAKKDSDPSKRP